ncbi:hypothetical protein [Nocardia cerradoensis]|uniref:hypothetical protein n=1 Tax=Nocardia cerradoensis TaxID=85688 RepID=UPI0012F6E2FA|nr:hypothetical protein [Nocardia cerradoensis]NKY45793.1 hypothetical protein [Nocardia cerradoensis]
MLVASADAARPIPMRDGFIRIPYRQRHRTDLFIDRVLLLGRCIRLPTVAPTATETLFAPRPALLDR